jgi:hypothetical protein
MRLLIRTEPDPAQIIELSSVFFVQDMGRLFCGVPRREGKRDWIRLARFKKKKQTIEYLYC